MESLKPSANILSGKRVIVAGAGIAGLSFVLSLRKQLQSLNVVPPASIKIYERASKETSIGREGYSLSIRGDGMGGGMQALQKMGLLDSMLDVSFTGTKHEGGFAIWDKYWKEMVKVRTGGATAGLPVMAMRIARDRLRKGLVHALSTEDSIHWSTPCAKAEQIEGGKIRVHLKNGEVDECDLLIVGDGASSVLRASLRPEERLSFAGAVILAGTANLPDGLPKPIDRDWGLVVGEDGTSLFASPIDDYRAVWSLGYLAPKPRTTIKPPISQEKVDELLHEALDRGRSFPEPFASLVKATDPSTIMLINAMDKHPSVHDYSGATSIIFIGDSSHAMSPFAGNGANMALMDGWDLADSLCKTSSLSAALVAYDAASIPRSKKAVNMSHWVISFAHAQGWKLTLYKFVFAVMKWFV